MATIRDPKFAVSVSASTTAQAPQVIYQRTVGGPHGAIVRSVSVSVDAVFQTNFYWQSVISGTDQGDSTPFQPFDPTVNVFDAVPQQGGYRGQQGIPVAPGAQIKISAYNHNSGNSTNGIMSVYVVFDQITQPEPAQATVSRNALGTAYPQ